jgi:hypothetical protein
VYADADAGHGSSCNGDRYADAGTDVDAYPADVSADLDADAAYPGTDVDACSANVRTNLDTDAANIGTHVDAGATHT